MSISDNRPTRWRTGRGPRSNRSPRDSSATGIQAESHVEDLTPTRSRISALATSPFQGEESKWRALFSSPGKGEVDSPKRSEGESGGGRNSRQPDALSSDSSETLVNHGIPETGPMGARPGKPPFLENAPNPRVEIAVGHQDCHTVIGVRAGQKNVGGMGRARLCSTVILDLRMIA